MKQHDVSSLSSCEDALRIARDLAENPDSLVAYPHESLENARHGRGFAFLNTIETDSGDLDGYVLVSTAGYGSGLLSAAGRTIDTVIAEHLARAEHVNRYIPDRELSPAHRLAIAAYDAGLSRIAELPGRGRVDATTADYAEFLLISFRRHRNSAHSGRNIVAHNDFLMRGPVAGRRYTQPCPHCACPAVYEASYPRAVCDRCRSRTTDRAGRLVTGFNTGLSGGMIAYFTDTLDGSDGGGSAREECVEVTQSERCFLDGQPVSMREARLGGIVVESLSPERRRRWWWR